MISISMVMIGYMVFKVTEKALTIVEQIQSGHVQLDIAGITDLVTQQSTTAEMQLINVVTTVFFICWLFGIVDSYRIACKQSKNDKL